VREAPIDRSLLVSPSGAFGATSPLRGEDYPSCAFGATSPLRGEDYHFGPTSPLRGED
jgi:hypothetical protein